MSDTNFMKNNLLILGVMALGAAGLLICCYAIFGFSYLFLLGVDYFSQALGVSEMVAHDIDATKVILTSIFFVLVGIGSNNYRKDIKKIEKTVREEVNSLHKTVEGFSAKLSELSSISEKLDSINSSIEEKNS